VEVWEVKSDMWETGWMVAVILADFAARLLRMNRVAAGMENLRFLLSLSEWLFALGWAIR
jgi:hypothetical protein